MDGHPKPKTKKYKNELYSDTRYAVIKWLEKELPLLHGTVLEIGAGNWKTPRQLLNSKNTEYTSLDKKVYGGTKNIVDVIGDVQALSAEWTNKWDNIICVEVLECVPNINLAMSEIFRVLKPGGTVFISCPFAYRWFGVGSWKDPKQGAPDYWRPTYDGWKWLTQKFESVEILNSGPNAWDPYGYMIKAKK